MVDWEIHCYFAQLLLESTLRAHCRPGATPLERLEARVACRLRSRPEALRQVADLLVSATGAGPEGEEAIRSFFLAPVADPAEALGAARAVLLLCGYASEHGVRLTGKSGRDFARLMGGEMPRDPGAPDCFAAPRLLEGYCHMGAGFARGVDAVFGAVTGRTLREHLSRAMTLLEPTAQSA